MKLGIDMGQIAGHAAGAGAGAALLDLEELLATRLLVQGNSGSGKSHLLRRLLEQSAPHVQQAVIDPEGDFVTLAEAHGHVVVEGDRDEADLQRIADRARRHRVSAVLTLEGLDAEAQMRRAAAFLGGLFDADRDHWYPMLVVVDEAQLFAPAVAGEVSDEARKASLGAMTNLMCRGRKRGLAGIIATQRLAKLAKNVAAEASNFLMGRTFLDIDMARAADLLGMERRQAEAFRDLARGSFVALGPALSRRPVTVTIGPVATAARSTSPVLMPLPEQGREEAQALLLAPSDDSADILPFRPTPRPAALTPAATKDILAQLARHRPAPEPGPSLSAEERAAAVEAALAEVVTEPDQAFRPMAVLYQDFLVRCRMRKVAGDALSLPAFRRRLAVARAGVAPGPADAAEWERAVEAAAGLTEDLQGVFLLIARAALGRDPCPSDDAVARACGSRSPGRARRLIAYMESRGTLVARTDRQGLRIIALPELGWETGPGDPRAVAAEDAPSAPRDLFAAE